MKNAINWFEIPVWKFREQKFYSSLIGTGSIRNASPEFKYAMLPADMQNGVGGGLVQSQAMNHLTKSLSSIWMAGGWSKYPIV